MPVADDVDPPVLVPLIVPVLVMELDPPVIDTPVWPFMFPLLITVLLVPFTVSPVLVGSPPIVPVLVMVVLESLIVWGGLLPEKVRLPATAASGTRTSSEIM